MLEKRRVQLGIFVVLVAALGVVGYWHIFVHSGHNHSAVASATSGPSTEDVQVDTQGDANVIVTYRSDLSTNQAVFDVDITSDVVNLTGYNYKSNLVLTDSEFDPLPNESIVLLSSSTKEMKVRLMYKKYSGNHFHFDVRNLAGIQDRVVHFYRNL